MNINSIFQQIEKIQQKPFILLQNKSQSSVHQFMRQWFTFGRNQETKNQYLYVWSLNHPFSLQQLSNNQNIQSSSFLTQQTTDKQEKIQDNHNKMLIAQQIDSGLTKIYFVNKGEVIIQSSNELILINPSLDILPQLKKVKTTVIIILTTANIKKIINFYMIKKQIQSSNKVKIKLITISDIYTKLNIFLSFIQPLYTQQNQPQGRQTVEAYLLKPNQYFQYGPLSWIVKQNCWYEPSYDLIFIIKDNHNNKINYLVQQSKLAQTKLIYYGWKKLFITQYRYQQFIKEWQIQIQKVQPGIIYEIQSKQAEKRRLKNDWYLQFVQKQLIQGLEDSERDELFHCCQLIELIPNQTIAKANLLFDYLYILLQGDFSITESTNGAYSKGKALNKQIYGLEQLKKRQQRYLFTLQTNSQATLFRILKNNVSFILYDCI